MWIYEWLELPYISPSSVHKALEEAGGEDIELYINSGGGSTWTGSEIYTAIKEYPGFKTVKIPSIAGSAASIIAMAGDKVLISPTAQIMIHRSAIWTDGNKQVHEQRVQMLTSVDEGMINAYVAKTGRTREEIRNLMENETFFNAQQALEWGFADEIMFATEELTPVASANLGAELPPDVLDKLRTKLLTANKSQKEPPAAQIIEPKTKEEPKTMDFKELQAKHPELVQEIMGTASQEAIKAERKRIADLNAMAGAPGAAEFIRAAIENGETAAEVAMKIVQASADRVKAEGKDRLDDSQNSNVNKVVAQAPADPAQHDEEDEEKSVNAMVEFAREFIA
ncbi:MAG: Clp protease ClpP, partial [Paenibacillus macerans]|nr:Clp protease ClpP [Paenibacillus macerans]